MVICYKIMNNKMKPIYVFLVLLVKAHGIKGQIGSPCPKIFSFEPDQSVDGWYGFITLSSQRDVKGITLQLEFDKSIIKLGNWLGAVTSDYSNMKFTIRNYNQQIKAGQTYKAEIHVLYDPHYYRYDYDYEDPPRLLKIKFNGKEICPNYEEEKVSTATRVIDSNDFNRSTIPLDSNLPKCGVTLATPTEFLFQGTYAKPGDYPWYAAIYKKNGQHREYLCGGSLISEKHILTVAHCVTRLDKVQDPKDFLVVLGKIAFWVNGSNEQTFSVTKIIVHENFNRSSFFNDISILKLDRAIEYTRFVRPICLWEESNSLSSIVKKTGTTVGFGMDYNNNAYTDLLLQAPMTVIDKLNCIFSYPKFYSVFLNANNFCGGYSNGTSICKGSSGSGLAFPRGNGRNTIWYLRGILSNAVSKNGTCDPNHYMIFTDVANYLEWISQNIKTNPEIPDDVTKSLIQTQKTMNCGTVAVRPKAFIAHGQDTIPGQWPWHAAVYHIKGVELVYECGASLISETHVLTAAHCVTKPRTTKSMEPEAILVYFGKYNLRFFGPETQDRDIIQINIHPGYNSSVFFNDIAIIELSRPVEITDYVRPVCLWEENIDFETIVNKDGIVVGWGFDENKRISQKLMQATTPVVSTTKCIYSNRDFFGRFTSDTNFCAGYINGTSVCNGDSGGSMVFPKRNTRGQNTVWQIRGIVSVGVPLQDEDVCDPSQYVIFTDVAKYLPWIRKIISSN